MFDVVILGIGFYFKNEARHSLNIFACQGTIRQLYFLPYKSCMLLEFQWPVYA